MKKLKLNHAGKLHVDEVYSVINYDEVLVIYWTCVCLMFLNHITLLYINIPFLITYFPLQNQEHDLLPE